jgi:hypothetical protein
MCKTEKEESSNPYKYSKDPHKQFIHYTTPIVTVARRLLIASSSTVGCSSLSGSFHKQLLFQPQLWLILKSSGPLWKRVRLLPMSDGQDMTKYERMTRRGSRQGATGECGGDVTGASRSGGVVPLRGINVGGEVSGLELINGEPRSGRGELGKGERSGEPISVGGVGGLRSTKLAGAEAGGMGSTIDCLYQVRNHSHLRKQQTHLWR